MPSTYPTRPFSATSQVYPHYLPALYKSGRVERRLATATVAAVGIGYGMAKYKQRNIAQQQQQQYSESAQSAAAAAATRKQQTEAIMDAYGDRSSLAELEAAVQIYDAQHRA
ncbi:hypothetical protein F4779DRAFT_623842 [Xylariaceae sp. FL0662B]|nr:hypothetical protein F4779DRAFT_623842 [Xylariaceae sp. FL0662B]